MSTDHTHQVVKKIETSFLFGIVLNLGFVIIEAVYGFVAHSMALLADAGHNFSDVIGLVMAWIASWLALQTPTKHFTYGFKSSTILATLGNATLLLIAVGCIILESIDRLRTPAPVSASLMVGVAGIGIVINTASALLFRSHNHDLNIRGVYLHMVSDALVALGVVVAGLVIRFTHWLWLDSAVSLGISVVIAIGTFRLFKDSWRLAIQAVPENIDPQGVNDFLEKLEGVKAVHDIHIWAMSTTENALTAHLVMKNGHPGDMFLADTCESLEHDFKIHLATIQIELGDSKPCKLD